MLKERGQMTSSLKLNVITFNVMAPVAPPLRFNGQAERMSRIPEAIRAWERSAEGRPLDVVAFQESIIKSQHMILRRGMKSLGFAYETDPLQGKVLKGKLVNGGVVIFSRHPILKQSSHVFPTACGCADSDCLAAKGWVYSKVSVGGRPVHVVACHLQAWNQHSTQRIRHLQATAIGEFCRGLSRDLTTEPLIVMGDLNADKYTQRKHLSLLVESMSVRELPMDPLSLTFSSDPRQNALMGNDEDSAYSSEEWPNGCYNEFLRTGKCVCCPTELLDYVFVSDQGLQPNNDESYTRVVPVRSSKPFIVNLTSTVRRAIRDLSDHFAVYAHLEFDECAVPNLPEIENPPEAQNAGEDLGFWDWIMPSALLAVLATLITALIIWGLKSGRMPASATVRSSWRDRYPRRLDQ